MTPILYYMIKKRVIYIVMQLYILMCFCYHSYGPPDRTGAPLPLRGG